MDYLRDMETKEIYLDSVDTYNKLYGLTTRHPLVAVVDLKDADRIVTRARNELRALCPVSEKWSQLLHQVWPEAI